MVLVRLWDDVNENYLVIDKDGCAQIIHHHKHLLHQGKAFTAKHIWYNQVADANSDILLVTGATKYLHLSYDYESTAKAEFSVHEDATVTNAGTAITAINRNRRVTTSAEAVATYGPNVSSTGIELSARLLSGEAGLVRPVSEGTETSFGEYLLKQSTTYLFRLTDKASITSDCMVALAWDEESTS